MIAWPQANPNEDLNDPQAWLKLLAGQGPSGASLPLPGAPEAAQAPPGPIPGPFLGASQPPSPASGQPSGGGPAGPTPSLSPPAFAPLPIGPGTPALPPLSSLLGPEALAQGQKEPSGPGPLNLPPGDEEPPPPPPAPPPPVTGGTTSIPFTGPAPPQALLNILLPGYSVQGNALVWTGTGQPLSFSDGGAAIATRLQNLAGPLAAKDYKKFFQNLMQGYETGATQSVLTNSQLTQVLKAAGFTISPPNASGNISKIQTPDGTWVRVITGNTTDGSGKWDWVPQGGGTTWGDPATQQLQNYAEQWLAQLQRQWEQWQRRIPDFEARMGGTRASVDRLVQYLQGRATELQGPAFTGPQMEIFRTQALDPLEQDRAAAQRRALQRISSAGYLPSSGVALDLQNQIDQPFDVARNQAQGELAYQTMAQERANQQEAQQLLTLIPQAQAASMTGDFSFLQALDQAMNTPRQAGLPLSSLIYDLPNRAMQQANAALGQGTTPNDLFSMMASLFGLQQGAQARNSQWYESLGALLAMLGRR